MTDESSIYTKVGKEFAQHGVVNHSAGDYLDGDKTTNTDRADAALRGISGNWLTYKIPSPV